MDQRRARGWIPEGAGVCAARVGWRVARVRARGVPVQWAAFSLPILTHLMDTAPRGKRHIRCLILAPTRELAAQIGENINQYGKYTSLRSLVIFGGVKQGKQVAALRKGVDILVATPGRLLDLEQQRELSLKSVEFFVLDEADVDARTPGTSTTNNTIW